MVNFALPIALARKLQIDFNRVTRNMQTQLSVYYLYGKTVDRTNSFIGEACFPQ
jgi:hypothetical protein